MGPDASSAYRFEDVPVDDVAPGSNVLVVTPGRDESGHPASARVLRSLFASAGADEGVVAVLPAAGNGAVPPGAAVAETDGPATVVAGSGVNLSNLQPAVERSTVSLDDGLPPLGEAIEEAVAANEDRGVSRNRIGVAGVGPLLDRFGSMAVYRFSHVLTTYVGEIDAACLYAAGPGVSERDRATVGKLFDATVSMDSASATAGPDDQDGEHDAG